MVWYASIQVSVELIGLFLHDSFEQQVFWLIGEHVVVVVFETMTGVCMGRSLKKNPVFGFYRVSTRLAASRFFLTLQLA